MRSKRDSRSESVCSVVWSSPSMASDCVRLLPANAILGQKFLVAKLLQFPGDSSAGLEQGAVVRVRCKEESTVYRSGLPLNATVTHRPCMRIGFV